MVVLVLVLVLVLDPGQRAGDPADSGLMFDHEKLDAYGLSIEFVARVDAILDGVARTGRTSGMKHLDEASTSVALNIAEGNGKRSIPDRVVQAGTSVTLWTRHIGDT